MILRRPVIDDSVISVGWDDKMRQASRSFSEETGLSGQPCHLASCASTTNLVLVITTAEVSLYRGLIKVTSLSVASSSSSPGGIGYDPTCGALLNEDEVAIGGSDSKTHIYSIVNDSLVEVTTISTRSPGDKMSTTLSCILMKCRKPSHVCSAVGAVDSHWIHAIRLSQRQHQHPQQQQP